MTQVASASTVKMYVNGAWTDAKSGRTMDVISPFDGRVVDTVPRADREDTQIAIQAAENALPAWSDTSPDERAALLFAGIEKVKAAAGELAKTLSAEQGKPVFEAAGEIHHFLHGMTFYAGLSSKIRGAQVPLPPDMGKHSYGLVLKRPVGVCAAIVPWNFPITLMGTKIGPALIAGNTVVVKPASTTPLTTVKIIALFNEAGLPPGVLNCVTGPGREVGEELLANPAVRRIAFTGESGTGRRVMEIAGPQFKRITLELGGSDPMILCADADVDAAVSAASVGRFFNCGQACLAIKRIFVAEEIADEFTEKLAGKVAKLTVGPGAAKGTRLGPLHSARGRELVEAQLADAVARGAEVLAGGGRPEGAGFANGHFLQPTLLGNVDPASRVATEEVFGPVLPVFRTSSLDEAIARANDSPYGLGSSIWTRDLHAATRAAERLEAGYTWINSVTKIYDELPFGGFKQSGLGQEHGSEALEAYLFAKSVVVAAG